MEQIKEFNNFNNSNKLNRLLIDISNLKDDWNGYGGKKINKKIIEIVEKIINNSNKYITISPTGRGSLQLDYHKNDEYFLELEINELKTNIYSLKNDDEIEIEIDTDINLLIEKINNF